MEGNTVWVVTLNNDEVVYQDDGRPGEEIESAWIRLGEYCKENNLFIKDMHIRFRSNCIGLDSNCDGYYFIKSVRAYWGSDRNLFFYIVGTLKDNKLFTRKYRVPELQFDDAEFRDPYKAGVNLICKNINQYSEQTV